MGRVGKGTSFLKKGHRFVVAHRAQLNDTCGMDVVPMGGAGYTLVIFSPNGASVLVETDSAICKLPTITVPRFERTIRHITNIGRERWNIAAVVLFSGVMGVF